ncbi:MAG: hypothetical protein ACKO9F_04980, partial [Caldilinea sp.]
MMHYKKALVLSLAVVLAVCGGIWFVAPMVAAPSGAALVEPVAALQLQTTVPISGVVFLDYNGDGFRSTVSQNPYAITTPASVVGSTTSGLWPVDPGIAGITATAYISGSVVPAATAVTDANGTYTLSLTAGQAYQIVFSGYQDKGYTESARGRLTVSGSGAAAQAEPNAYTNNGITIVPSVGNGFVIVNLTSGAALNHKLHFGLLKAELYSNVVPRVAWSQGTVGTTASPVGGSLTRLPIMNSWTGGTELWSSQTAVLERDKVGTVWGLAYQNISDLLFASSLMRRYGPALASDSRSDTLFLIGNNRNANPNANPGGSGTTGTLLGQISLASLGIDTGAAITRTLSAADAEAFALVGKRGIGGIDLTTSGYNSTLYLANLTDRKIYGLQVGVPATTTLSSADVVELPDAPWITGDPCNGLGPARPWAVKVYDDTLYVGLVCTGENAPNRLIYVNAGTASASGGWNADREFLSTTDAATRAVQVSMGGRHACMVNGVGGVQCWGSNAAGQLGNGTTVDSNVLVQVSGLVSGVVEVKASRPLTDVTVLSSCALLANGTVRCWGDGSRGQLGQGSTTDSTTPVQVETSAGVPLANVTQISAGISHFCAISAGNLFCWGRNDFGQVGNNTTLDQNRPVQVLTGGVTSVAGGGTHTCAVQAGALWCWGLNDSGQLGRGSNTNSSIPVNVVSSNVAQVDANRHNTCVLTSNGGQVMCAGEGDYYANGDGSTTDQTSFVFVKIQGSGGSNLADATAVAVSSTGACALMGDSRLMCWGLNASGELANGNTGVNGQAIYSNVSGVQS